MFTTEAGRRGLTSGALYRMRRTLALISTLLYPVVTRGRQPDA